MFVDYYKLLGINRTASASEIRIAYHRLARKYHPDKCHDDADSTNKFILISRAYQILYNLENRLKYRIELENYESESTFNDFENNIQA